ncbi:SNARE protein TLG1/Syntaxin [Laccaria bicolor S238N-H82]|uniref:SNARE protein TLG1/Syntaxin n=1 Tax=Laccaria bicolor (strain S238N-H82 / ATCC MYA-4686) TaxID=486041 RepID=B0DBS7_LACBS|nr:SNARE protein TLG1/Syntaxin [Laccaria bicolor S238N-H82]EDR08233.1 SNARE protein TLG1/Syntaxin [Laccaria bicolor S238N-H82]|eukprot:XP_001881303.1 SNARE protein TLG1/Syntaxin [Laccaria bicolor S238N-H82]
MSVDPYHAVQQEIQTSLQTAAQLRSSYLRIRNMASEDSEELMWARNELKATLAALEADLEDLEESVKIVESTDARMFGLDDAEVQTRRQYVGHVRKEIESMRTELTASSLSIPRQRQTSDSTQRDKPGSPFSDQYGDDHQAEWAREEQQMMIREQDNTMDSIAGTLNTLAQQASLMGQEIGQHNEMLDDLEQNVDKTDTKLSDAMRRLRKFLRDSEERGSGWCIVILILVLMALLLAVILV